MNTPSSSPVLNTPPAPLRDHGAVHVLSFNIRLGWGERNQPNAWINRKGACIDIMRGGEFDFIGLQEVVFHPELADVDQYRDIRDGLPGYGIVGRSRDAAPDNGEGVLLLYRTDRWEPVETGVFWLSETPDVPASRSWDTACTRIAAWGRFRELRDGTPTGRTVLAVNTHLDHILEHTQIEQARVVAEFIAATLAPGEPAFLTGDFNAYEYSWPMRYLTGAPIAALGVPIPASPLPLADSWRALHPTAKDAATYHGWGNPYASPHRIDYILATMRPLAAAIHALPAPFPSDHHPVTALLEL